jgi:2-polyprenyl-3-methyl-5-hydroxy-6-metoxy-1,4-benzoquinol methylase
MTQLAVPEIDQKKSDLFGERMLGVLNEAAVALMTSIGYRTGLFDTMAKMPPSTSQQIADRANLNERYVREWLGALVTGGVIRYDESSRTYSLPPEHAAWLTRSATPNNLAATMQWFAVLGRVEDEVSECFRNGGGVEYCHYHRFHDVMAEESAQTVVAGLLDHILPLEPALRSRLESGIEVLDVGCGAGKAINLLAENFSASRFTGYDLCQEAITTAQAEARLRGFTNVRFETRDVTHLGEPDHYDLITAFDAIHDQANPAAVLREIHAALRPGGTFLMQDIAASSHLHKNMDHPLGPFLYTVSTMHCMSVSLAQGGAGLGTVWGEELARKMLAEAGFIDVRVEQLPHDIQNNYYLANKR